MEVRDDLGLIVMENCKELGKKVDKEIQKIRNSDSSFIIPSKCIRFQDGEGKAVILESCRGKDIYILSDTHNHSISYNMYGYLNHMSPDDHYQDIKRIVSACMGHAKSIKVIMPLLYESRQHKRKDRESLDCAMALQELSNLGVSGFISFDVHNIEAVQNAIPTLPFDNFYPTNDLLKLFFQNEDLISEDTVVINPDEGASERARFLADILEADTGGFKKRRDYFNVQDGKNPVVSHEYTSNNDVMGKTVIIVDDMLASGGSLLNSAIDLKKRGAKRIFFFVTFALFTSTYQKFCAAYEQGLFDGMYATNLNYVPDEVKKEKWFHLVDCSNYLAQAIDCLNRGNSISTLTKDNSAIKLMRERKQKDNKKI